VLNLKKRKITKGEGKPTTNGRGHKKNSTGGGQIEGGRGNKKTAKGFKAEVSPRWEKLKKKQLSEEGRIKTDATRKRYLRGRLKREYRKGGLESQIKNLLAHRNAKEAWSKP